MSARLILAGSVLLVALLVGSGIGSVGRNLLVGLRARLTTLSLAMGREQAVWKLLPASDDPSLRTAVIHRISPMATSPANCSTNRRDKKMSLCGGP